MSDTVFYAWCNDLPNKTNRTLIEDALERAVRALRDDKMLDIDPRVDRDTLGEAGAPEIASTILAKIDRAWAIVADLSIVNEGTEGRPTPNPNVVFELGYAYKAFGPKRVIQVFNTAYGTVEQLPFDLRGKRSLTYHLTRDQEPGEARAALAQRLEAALRSVLTQTEEDVRREAHGAFFSELNQTLIRILLNAEQAPNRMVNPFLEEIQHTLGSSADALRDAASRAPARELDLSDDLEELASILDRIEGHLHTLGGGQEYKNLVAAAAERARNLKAAWIDDNRLHPEAVSHAREEIDRLQHRLNAIGKRAARALEEDDFDDYRDIQHEAIQAGEGLLWLSYYNLDAIEPDLSEKLHDAGSKLSDLALERVMMDGGDSVRRILRRVVDRATEADEISLGER